MTYWQRLWRVEVIGLASLCVFAVAVAAILVLEGLIISPMEFGFFDSAFLGFAFTFVFGFFPVCLFAAPIYTAFIASDKFHWSAMLIVAVLPGIAILSIRQGLGIIAIVGGACIFFMVHIAFHRWIIRPRSDAA